MNESVKILPSLMCERPWEMPEYVAAFEESHVAAIHFDVMDGHYVPNLMLGTDDLAAVRSLTSLPVDVHLMAANPDDLVRILDIRAGDWCSFHPEVALQPYRILQDIRDKGARAGVALSPAVPVSYVEECLEVLDFVLVMAVNPGFAGQKMVPGHLGKLTRIASVVSGADHPVDIVVDGNTTPEHARAMVTAGATGLVVGTSTLLKEGPDRFVALEQEYRKAIEG